MPADGETRHLPALALERHQNALDTAGTHPPFHLNSRDALELPPLRCVLIEDLLQLVARHLPADHAFAQFDNLVLECHTPMPSASVCRVKALGLGSFIDAHRRNHSTVSQRWQPG